MEKISHPIRERLSFVRLYLDDIENLLTILKEEGFSNIKVKNIEHQYSDDEFNKIKPKKPLDEIVSNVPFYISISLGRDVDVYASVDTALAQGVVKKITNLLKKKKRKAFSIITNPWLRWSLFIPSLLISNILSFENIISFKMMSVTIFVSLILFNILNILDSPYYSKRNIIILEHSVKQQSFFMRNKDQLIVNAICIIIGSLVGSLITYIIGK